jgi:hypothetical protein
MDRAAEKYCRSCHGCQLVARPDPPEPIRSTTLPEGPWLDVATDLLGPFPSGHSILVVVDYYSRYYEYAILQSTVTTKIIDSLEEVFSRHGMPRTIKSDNGPQFVSNEFKQFCEQNGIRPVKVTPKWAQANGEVERQNQSLVKRIQIAQAEGLDWKRELLKYVFKYRTTEHATTGKTPAELLFGRKLRGKLPDLSARGGYDLDVRDRDAEQKGRSKLYADERRGAKPSEVDVGDKILLKADKVNKFSTTFQPTPYTVVSKTGNNVMIQSPEGVQYSRNTSHVKKFITPQPEQKATTDNLNNNDLNYNNPTARETFGSSGTLDASKSAPAQDTQVQARPQRSRRPPEKFKDYVRH